MSSVFGVLYQIPLDICAIIVTGKHRSYRDWETGYRCKNFPDILNAMKNIEEGNIASIDCRAHGEQYSDEKIHEKHHQYLQRLISGKFYE